MAELGKIEKSKIAQAHGTAALIKKLMLKLFTAPKDLGLDPFSHFETYAGIKYELPFFF